MRLIKIFQKNSSRVTKRAAISMLNQITQTIRSTQRSIPNETEIFILLNIQLRWCVCAPIQSLHNRNETKVDVEIIKKSYIETF